MIGRRVQVWVALLLLATFSVSGLAVPLILDHAGAKVSVDGATSIQDLRLPYAWEKINKGQQGRATFELTFDVAEPPTEP